MPVKIRFTYPNGFVREIEATYEEAAAFFAQAAGYEAHDIAYKAPEQLLLDDDVTEKPDAQQVSDKQHDDTSKGILARLWRWYHRPRLPHEGYWKEIRRFPDQIGANYSLVNQSQSRWDCKHCGTMLRVEDEGLPCPKRGKA